jgi:FixJ family two-component response regulator
VIVLTGKPDVQNTASLLKQGVVDYLVKPVDAAKLTAAVQKAVKGHVLFKDKFTT